MYSGTTFRVKSGRVMGVHQRIDRVARKQINKYIPSSVKFPETKEILHFEGKNGPDGIKRKNPSKDEPWHFINPADKTDRQLIKLVEGHIDNLARALKEKDEERAAFEAAWMAHAVVDGLTPAHHFTLEEEMTKLRGGKGNDYRDTVFKKIFLPGNTTWEVIENNWKAWGAKGLMTTHFMFEIGVAVAIRGVKLTNKDPFSEDDIAAIKRRGFTAVFEENIDYVYSLKMYDRFIKKGWNRKMATEVKDILIPICDRMVCAGWYQAIIKSLEK